MINAVSLREVMTSDLPIFFDQQADDDARHMAAFTIRDPADRDAFMAHWARVLADKNTLTCTILLGEQVAGNIASFTMEGERDIGYWLGRAFWGQGVATQALMQFLKIETTRPIYARVAFDNIASRRVLEKCGFVFNGTDMYFANARGVEIEELIFRLAQIVYMD